MKKSVTWVLIAAAAVAALLAANWPALRFVKLEGGEFVSRLGALLLFAFLIERTAEVFLTIWRAEGSYKLEAEVQRLLRAGKAPTAPDLQNAQDRQLAYKAETQRLAMPANFILGLLIASFGVRVIEQFMVLPDVGTPDRPGEIQLWCFHVADIFLTAALLAGGADPIHKLMDTFRKFMEASSAKASGTME